MEVDRSAGYTATLSAGSTDVIVLAKQHVSLCSVFCNVGAGIA
jgi:hypothetical protein